MQVPCRKCEHVTDLTEFNVGIGHVFDCEGCNEPLRAMPLGIDIVGIPVSEIPRPTLPTMPESGPGARA